MSDLITSNFRVIYLQTSFIVVATALVILRLYVRSRIVRNIGLDDVFIVFGLAFAIASSVTIDVTMHYYLSSSISYRLLNVISANELFIVTEIIVLVSTMLTRISICFFLLRLSRSRKSWRLGLYSIILFAVITNVSTAFVVLLGCKPVQSAWDTRIKGACWSTKAQVSIAYFQGASAVFLDWTLALLPIVFIRDVQMSVKFKATICVLMGMGIFSGACALARSLTTYDLARPDIPAKILPWIRWLMFEQSVGIMAACIPTLKPLLQQSFHFHWPKGLRRRSSEPVNDVEEQSHALTYTSKTVAVGVRQPELEDTRASE